MHVMSWCQHRVITITPQADLAEAAALMRSKHVGLLVVVNPGDTRPVGVLTDRDIVVEVIARNLSPAMICVCRCDDTGCGRGTRGGEPDHDQPADA
ncbi:MAG: CBS domain-containing protein [Steroidobacteraceae bacterium]